MHSVEKYQNNAVTLLKQLISIKSFSFQEDETADTIQEWLKKNYYVIVPELVSSSKISNVISSYFSIYGITFVGFLVNISQVCKLSLIHI